MSDNNYDLAALETLGEDELRSNLLDGWDSNQDRLDEIKSGYEITDSIYEIADSLCPIYTSDILSYAANHTWLATDVPDIGPAFDGTSTPVNIIVANIYEHLVNHLYSVLRDIEDELEELVEAELDIERHAVSFETLVTVGSNPSSAIGWCPANEHFGDKFTA